MIQKTLLGLVFAGLLAVSAPAADVVIRVAPPRVLVEKRPPQPSRNHVWVSGYHRWDGNAYQWQAGKWDQPPAGNHRWVAHHYVRRNGGYVLVDGHWQ
jgi:opacity protein-like surface antigen